jgi:Glyoxalase-like domain
MVPSTHVSNSRSLTEPHIRIDHVLIAVPDLAAAQLEFETRHGLRVLGGGRHPGWGTANRIVPLGETYLELVSVVDEAEAAENQFGRWVKVGASDLGHPLGWAVRTNNFDGAVARLGLRVERGSRKLSSGETLRWQIAGLDAAASNPVLPFFIQWAKGVQFPGRHLPSGQSATQGALIKLFLQGDENRLASWLGHHALPIVVRLGVPAVVGVLIAGALGEILVGSENLDVQPTASSPPC